MKVDVGIIGGTGIGDRLLKYGGKPVVVPTAEGPLRGRLTEVEGMNLLLISRHSGGHKVPPHLVNYKAIALGLQILEVKGCFASAAVGSLRRDWGPGTLVACSDFVDLTYRNLTLFDREVVHRDFTDAFGPTARKALLDAGHVVGAKMQSEGVYLALNGPRYETQQEIDIYRQMGIDLVGMTAASEAILMREAKVEYACLAVVTNLAAGYTEQPLNHQEVVDEMNRTGETAVEVLLQAAKNLAFAA